MTAKRIIGMVMLMAALLFGAAEFWYSIVPTYGAGEITMGRLWFLVSARSMDFVQNLITQYLWSPIWDMGISAILVAPAWCFFGVLGFLFFVFGQPKVSDR